jgi:hypothetical protein
LNGRVRDELLHIEQFGLLTMPGNTVPLRADRGTLAIAQRADRAGTRGYVARY